MRILENEPNRLIASRRPPANNTKHPGIHIPPSWIIHRCAYQPDWEWLTNSDLSYPKVSMMKIMQASHLLCREILTPVLERLTYGSSSPINGGACWSCSHGRWFLAPDPRWRKIIMNSGCVEDHWLMFEQLRCPGGRRYYTKNLSTPCASLVHEHHGSNCKRAGYIYSWIVKG
jgi:hypothetical protein